MHRDFSNEIILVFVKDRWTGLAPIAGAAQVQAMPPKA